jgi:hypothetical protein
MVSVALPVASSLMGSVPGSQCFQEAYTAESVTPHYVESPRIPRNALVHITSIVRS